MNLKTIFDRSFLRLTGAAVILGSLSVQAGTIREDQSDSAYLSLAQSPQYASVGVFANSWNYTGCGVLISPEWILTSAHLFTAATSGSFTISGTTYTANQLIKDPGWNGSALAGYDFGLAHLSTPVTGVTPAQLYQGSSEIGQTATFVGFGSTGTGLTGATTLDYKERAFQNIIDGDFGNPLLLLGSDFDNPNSIADSRWGDAVPLTLEGAVSNGDSGGGVFIDVNGQSYLAGVISAIVATDGNANSDYGDLSAFGRVSAYTSWIGGYVPTAVPEPSSFTLFVFGSCVVLLRRQRQA